MAAATQSACAGRARLKAVGGQGTRGAHPEHILHDRDAGGVEAERLVERLRGLPSRNAGMRWEEVRPERREGVGVAATQSARTGRDRLKAGRRERAERTWNMLCMFVTLEVSQLEMSALTFCKL